LSDQSDVDVIVIGTPINFGKPININKPNTRVRYDLQEFGRPNLEDILSEFVKKHKLK